MDDAEYDRLVAQCLDLGPRPTLEAIHKKVVEYGYTKPYAAQMQDSHDWTTERQP